MPLQPLYFWLTSDELATRTSHCKRYHIRVSCKGGSMHSCSLQEAAHVPASQRTNKCTKLRRTLFPAARLLDLVDVSKVGVLLVRYVLESMHKCLIVGLLDTLGGQPVTLLVLCGQVPTQEKNVYNEQTVATKMSSKGNEVARAVPGQKDLRSCRWKEKVSQEADRTDCIQNKTYRWHFQ